MKKIQGMTPSLSYIMLDTVLNKLWVKTRKTYQTCENIYISKIISQCIKINGLSEWKRDIFYKIK